MKSFRSFRINAIAAALAVAMPAIHAANAPTSPDSKVTAVADANQAHSRFIVTYRDGSAERGSSTAALQNVKAAIGRTGLDRATISSTGANVAPLSVTHQRKLAVGSDLIRTSRKLSQNEANNLMLQIAADPAVAHVQPDLLLQAVKDFRAPADLETAVRQRTNAQPKTFTPDDPGYATYQWHFSNPIGGANINHAWDLADGTGITVAVIDTGITDHPDIDTSLADAGYDFISDAYISGRTTDAPVPGGWDTGDWTNEAPWNTASDGCVATGGGEPSSWHGTHVSGTVAELTNNGSGMAGIAYNAKVLPLRALGHCGGYESDIADAIVWASGGHVDGLPDNTHVAQVINMSLGGAQQCAATSPEYLAIQQAIGRGVTVIASAGNSAADVSSFTPAGCAGVIAVASNGITGKRAFYSNYGNGVTLSAPGGGVYPNDGTSGQPVNEGFVFSALNDGETTPGAPNYAGYAGTSQASPHVAGTVAMILGATQAAGMPAPTPDEIKTILTESARPFPVAQDHVIGAGIVDAAAAVNLAVNGDDGDPGDGDGDGDGGNDPGTTLTKGVILSGQAVGTGTAVRYSITVPAGATTLNIRTIGGSGGDVSLYVKAGHSPAADGSNADFKSVKPGNNEAVVLQKPEATTYYILVTGGESATNNLSVLADYKL